MKRRRSTLVFDALALGLVTYLPRRMAELVAEVLQDPKAVAELAVSTQTALDLTRGRTP